jgi:hypothetical protein
MGGYFLLPEFLNPVPWFCFMRREGNSNEAESL